MASLVLIIVIIVTAIFFSQIKALDMLSNAKDFLLDQIRNANVLTELEVSATENFITGIGNLLQSFSQAIHFGPGMDDLKRMQMMKVSLLFEKLGIVDIMGTHLTYKFIVEIFRNYNPTSPLF